MPLKNATQNSLRSTAPGYRFTTFRFATFFLFAALSVWCITGCNGGDSGSGDGESGKNGSEAGETGNGESGDKPRIAFVTNQIASFWNIAEVGALDAAEDCGVEAVVKFPSEGVADIQKQVVEDLLTSQIDALAISPIDSANQVGLVNQWCEAVPLIIHDSDAVDSNRLCFIGVDNYAAGRLLGKMIARALPDGGNIIICVGRMEQDNAQKRRQGVIDELFRRSFDPQRLDPVEDELEANNYRIIATLTDQGVENVAKEKAEDAINAHADLNMFVGLFAYNPPQCLAAVRQAGKLDSIQIAGFDEDNVTLQGIQDGEVIGTVVQNPYEYGYQSIKLLSEILKGDTSGIPENKIIDIPARGVTLDGSEFDGTKTEKLSEFWAELKAKTGE